MKSSPAGDLHGVRLRVCPEFFDADDEVAPVAEAALKDLEELGATIVGVAMPWLDDAIAVGGLILAADSSAWHQSLLRSKPGLYHPGTRTMLEYGELIPATHYVNAQRVRSRIISSMREVFRSNRLHALVGPTLPILSLPIDELAPDILAPASTRSIADYVHHCLPANVTGQPALTIPVGFAEPGLPVGLQFVGPANADEALLSIAQSYELAHDWHTRRPAVATGYSASH